MDKVERVARALRQASGKDPDSPFSTDELEITPTPGGGHTQQSREAPVWTKFEAEARRFVAAAEALGTITSGG